MKIIYITILVLFYSVLSLGQTSDGYHADTLRQAGDLSRVFLHSENVMTAQNSVPPLFTGYSELQRPDNCLRYKKMKKTGIILASVSGGVFLVGIASISAGFQIAFSQVGGSPAYEQNLADGLIIGGGLSIGLGFTGICTGVPLAVIGSVRMKKNCGERKSSMLLSTNGNELGLNF